MNMPTQLVFEFSQQELTQLTVQVDLRVMDVFGPDMLVLYVPTMLAARLGVSVAEWCAVCSVLLSSVVGCACVGCRRWCDHLAHS